MCEQSVQVRHGEVLWHIRASWKDNVVGDAAPNWFALQKDPRAVRVKTGHQRSTWRATLGDRTVFAKVVSAAGAGGGMVRLKQWVIGTAAEREWRACREAEVRGITVVSAVAVGVRSGSSPGTVFLSEALIEAQPLPDVWDRRVACVPLADERQATIGLIDTVARLFAVSHERGFVHGDAHPSNILVFVGTSGAQEAAFVDVHSARVTKSPASLRSTLGALAHFDQYFQRRASRAERLRFLRRYLDRRPSLSTGGSQGAATVGRELLTALAQAKASHASRLAHQRDRRLCRNGKYFSTLTLPGGWEATVVQQLERRHLFPEPHVADRTESDWRTILEPLVARIAGKELSSDTVDNGRCLVEVEQLDSLSDRLTATLRGSRHRRLFEQCHKQRHRDIPSPLILACAEHRSTGLVDATLLVRVRR